MSGTIVNIDTCRARDAVSIFLVTNKLMESHVTDVDYIELIAQSSSVPVRL